MKQPAMLEMDTVTTNHTYYFNKYSKVHQILVIKQIIENVTMLWLYFIDRQAKQLDAQYALTCKFSFPEAAPAQDG